MVLIIGSLFWFTRLESLEFYIFIFTLKNDSIEGVAELNKILQLINLALTMAKSLKFSIE